MAQKYEVKSQKLSMHEIDVLIIGTVKLTHSAWDLAGPIFYYNNSNNNDNNNDGQDIRTTTSY